MNYSETIDYLYNTLPMFSRMGSAAFKKDFTNIKALCNRLGNPHHKFKTIHVGGTNGKGSVSHMLAAIFQHAGYKTGLYTSPHLYDFRERIRVNGEMVPEEFVTGFVERMKPVLEEIEPSFFEITVAMAFEAFAEQAVDIAIIEVGLGGRLDSTNIITPELSIITNIGWDHMNMLGNSLEEIAGEKAGIIKPGIPVVIGESLPATRPVFERKAVETGATLIYAEGQFTSLSYSIQPDGLEANYQAKDIGTLTVQTDLGGIYQVQNLRTVLTSVQVLKQQGWKIDENSLHEALRKVKEQTGLMGRWEVIRQRPMVVLEVAHNKDGITQMLRHMEQLTFSRLHLVIGMVKDKDAEEVLRLLPANATYYFTHAHIPRALAAEQLQAKAKSMQLAGEAFDHVNDALEKALANASPDDLVVVCGSIFLVAEVNRNIIEN